MKTNTFPDINQTMVDDFLTSKQLVGWSDSMLKRAKKRLAVFCVDFLENPEVINNGFSGWRNQLEERSLSTRTVNEYITVTKQFVEYASGKKTDSKGKRALDLTGRTFGQLTVLEKSGGRKSKERSFLWKCQCSCGKIVEIPANQLTKGYHTSCGCQKAERLKEANQYVDGTSLKMIFSDTVRQDNTSGYKGVYQKEGRWAARIQYKGKRYYLGVFDKLEDAVAVRKEAEEKIREDARLLDLPTGNR